MNKRSSSEQHALARPWREKNSKGKAVRWSACGAKTPHAARIERSETTTPVVGASRVEAEAQAVPPNPLAVRAPLQALENQNPVSSFSAKSGNSEFARNAARLAGATGTGCREFSGERVGPNPNGTYFGVRADGNARK